MKRASSPAGPPTDLDHEEIEWQFAVDDLAEAERRVRSAAASSNLRLEPRDERELLDLYLETGDWAFHRAGFVLRVRDRGGSAEATLKARSTAGGGPRRRREINERLAGPDRLALLTGTGSVAERVRAVAGVSELRPLFVLRTQRRSFDLREGDAVLAEIALDSTTAKLNGVRDGGGAAVELRRLELEVSGEGSFETVEPFARQLLEGAGLPPASSSKFEAGLAAAALRPADPPDLGPLEYDRGSRLVTVAYAALRRQLRAYLANEPGTRLGEEIEALHDMRVASRRMRTALRLFSDALPPDLVALGDDLRWVASVLGDVRDLDVQLESLGAHAEELKERDALEPLRARLEQMRREARTRMLAALDSPRHQELVKTLTAALRAGRTTAEGERPSLLLAPKLLRASRRRLHRLARTLDRRSPDEDYHQARIRAKRLRYASEFVVDLYGRPARRVVAALKDVQEELGRGQDATIAIQRLRSLAAAEPALPPPTLFAMGRLAEREARTLSERGDAFEAIYARFRKRWARLDRALARELEQRA